VADEVEPVHFHGVGQGQDVRDQVVQAVVGHRRGPGPGGVAALVGGNGAISRIAELAQLAPPGPGRLRKAVEEDDTAAAFGSGGARGEGQPVGVDLEALDHPEVISWARDGSCCRRPVRR